MIEKSYTDEEIAEIVRKHGLPRYPKLALYREKLSRKAKAEPNFRFYCLYGQLLRMDVLKCAYEQVRANKGAPGVDKLTFGDIERGKDGVDGFLTSIQQELKAKTYRASPVKRVYIEKANGKLRPLGIPTIKDRTIQAAVKLVIEPIFEADFHDCSFGFRPNRNAQQAVERIAKRVKGGQTQVYDADLSSYFDTIPHDKLFLALRKRITDGSVLALIRQWLKATIVEPSGVKKNPRGKGTPQGGVISPLLSNIYLHWFETCAMLTAKATGQVMSIVRYADDFVILARKLQGRFVQEIERELEGRFGLVGVRFFLVEPKSCFHAGDFVAIRVWQCHLRNVSTLSNRTRRELPIGRILCIMLAEWNYGGWVWQGLSSFSSARCWLLPSTVALFTGDTSTVRACRGWF